MATDKSYKEYLQLEKQIADMEKKIAQQTDLIRKRVQVDYLYYLMSLRKNKMDKGGENSYPLPLDMV